MTGGITHPSHQHARSGRGVAVLAVAFLVLHALLYADRRTLASFTQLGWGVMVGTALLDRAMPFGQRLARVLPAYIFSLAVAFGAAVLWGEPAAAMRFFLRYQVWVVWLVVLWLAAPIWRVTSSRWLSALSGFAVLHAGLCFVSACASPEPKLSMKLFGSDLGVYVSLMLILLRLATDDGADTLRRSARWHLSLIGLVVTVMFAVLLAYGIGPDGSRTALERFGWVLSESGDGGTTWRLLFPFQHHNRTGFFAMTAVFVLLAYVVTPLSPVRQATGAVTAAVAFVCLAFTLTRAALAAAFLGLLATVPLLMLARRRPRYAMLLVLVLPVTWFALPDAHRTRIRQVADPAAWIPGRETTTGARMVLWDRTASLIAQRPLIGHGYGYERFEQVFNEANPDLVDKLGGTSHAHNQWLQAAAESGLPAALALLAFTMARWAMLVAAISLTRGRDPTLVVWLGLEMAIQAYLLTNYTLRYSIGAYTYCIWAVSAVMALQALKTPGAVLPNRRSTTAPRP